MVLVASQPISAGFEVRFDYEKGARKGISAGIRRLVSLPLSPFVDQSSRPCCDRHLLGRHPPRGKQLLATDSLPSAPAAHVRRATHQLPSKPPAGHDDGRSAAWRACYHLLLDRWRRRRAVGSGSGRRRATLPPPPHETRTRCCPLRKRTRTWSGASRAMRHGVPKASPPWILHRHPPRCSGRGLAAATPCWRLSSP